MFGNFISTKPILVANRYRQLEDDDTIRFNDALWSQYQAKIYESKKNENDFVNRVSTIKKKAKRRDIFDIMDKMSDIQKNNLLKKPQKEQILKLLNEELQTVKSNIIQDGSELKQVVEDAMQDYAKKNGELYTYLYLSNAKPQNIKDKHKLLIEKVVRMKDVVDKQNTKESHNDYANIQTLLVKALKSDSENDVDMLTSQIDSFVKRYVPEMFANSFTPSFTPAEIKRNERKMEEVRNMSVSNIPVDDFGLNTPAYSLSDVFDIQMPKVVKVQQEVPMLDLQGMVEETRKPNKKEKELRDEILKILIPRSFVAKYPNTNQQDDFIFSDLPMDIGNKIMNLVQSLAKMTKDANLERLSDDLYSAIEEGFGYKKLNQKGIKAINGIYQLLRYNMEPMPPMPTASAMPEPEPEQYAQPTASAMPQQAEDYYVAPPATAKATQEEINKLTKQIINSLEYKSSRKRNENIPPEDDNITNYPASWGKEVLVSVRELANMTGNVELAVLCDKLEDYFAKNEFKSRVDGDGEITLSQIYRLVAYGISPAVENMFETDESEVVFDENGNVSFATPRSRNQSANAEPKYTGLMAEVVKEEEQKQATEKFKNLLIGEFVNQIRDWWDSIKQYVYTDGSGTILSKVSNSNINTALFELRQIIVKNNATFYALYFNKNIINPIVELSHSLPYNKTFSQNAKKTDKDELYRIWLIAYKTVKDFLKHFENFARGKKTSKKIVKNNSKKSVSFNTRKYRVLELRK
jgi:hypothetical protein